MKSNVLASGLAVVLGLAGVVGLADVAVAQTSVEVRRVEADLLLEQGARQLKIGQFELALCSTAWSLISRAIAKLCS